MSVLKRNRKYWILLLAAAGLLYASYELVGGTIFDYYRDVQQMAEPEVP